MATTQQHEPSITTHAYKRGEPLAKRRRTSLACTACRLRKSRCDGLRPSCATCASLALECQYEPAKLTANVLARKAQVSDLEQRLEAVEGSLQRLEDVERALQRHDDLLKGHLSRGPSADHLSFDAGSRAHDGIQLKAASEAHQISDEAKTDGLAIIFVNEKDQEFYGETSNIIFIRFLLRAFSVASNPKEHGAAVLGKEDGAARFNPAFASPQTLPSTMETPRNAQISHSTLPVGDEMDYLLDTYFTVYGSLFPFLHEPTFRETYNEYKANSIAKVRRTWLGLLNMTFAMASNVDQRADVLLTERSRKSYIFFMRAAALCGELSMRTVSLDIVRYLLLDVLYLQGTQHSVQAWNMHGILVRTAIALGLQSQKSGQGLDPIQQEIRRRTWYTIYCLDNLLSVTYGRSPLVPAEHMVVQLPSPWICTSDLSQQHHQSGTDINTEFLNATVRLHLIMGRSVTDQYGMNLGLIDQDQEMDETTAIQVANKIRQELRRWASSLPPHLSLCKPGSEILLKSTDINRLRVILTLRHHFANILIHRPLLYATLDYLTIREEASGSTLPYKMQLAIAEAHECIRSAESTIEIVHTILSAQRSSHSNLGVWFFTMFYVFTSSLVILGRSVLAQHGVHIDEDAPGRSVQSLLAKAVESLDKLDKGNRLVYNCAKFIRQLSERQSRQGAWPNTSVSS
ncbi:C6 transcription factor [Trichoderma barbatum]